MSSMPTGSVRCLVAAATLVTAGAVSGAVPAVAAPTLASDGQGYVDSTARCASPATAVVFGSTATSRVAICSTADGLQYRGVRVRDGARLVADATRTDDGDFTATSDGIEYLVTPKALVVSSGSTVLRDEAMLDFHRPSTAGSPAPPMSSPGPGPETPTTPTTSLPPPLPAEVGGGSR
jgi:hypothetical protein